VTELLRDARYGLCLLWKSPGFTAVSLFALALGIGAITAIFSLLYSVLLAPLPYPHAVQLVMVWSHQKGDRIETSPQDYLDWQKQSTVFASLNAWTGAGFTISTPEWTEQVHASRVAPGFFDLLFGEKPHLGRHFIPEDTQAGNDHVIILNYRFWRDRFGGDPGIVGKVLRTSGEPFTVVGVAAPSPSDKGDADLTFRWRGSPEKLPAKTTSCLSWAPETRCHTFRSQRRDVRHRPASGTEQSQDQPRTDRHRRAAQGRLPSPKHPDGPLADVRRGRFRAPHRLREHPQFAAGLGHGAA
jgi:hypothetical protein